MKQIIQALRDWWVRYKQKTFCYCPTCRNELCGDKQSGCYDGGTFVTYDCSRCHTESTWDFDGPTPLLIASQVKP